jgi:Tetratricopeptide repeat
MRRDHLAFLLGGLAFGVLIGFGLFETVANRPGAQVVPERGGVPSVAGPGSPTDVTGSGPAATMGGGGAAPGGAPAGGPPAGGAPMLAELNALKERVQKDPKDFESWTRLGNLYQDAGMFQPAIGFYEKASALRPGDAGVLTDTGICYQQLNQLDKALDLFERAHKADPLNWQSLYNTVVVAGIDMGRYDKADEAFAKLKQVKPDAPNLDALRAALDRARSQGPRPN